MDLEASAAGLPGEGKSRAFRLSGCSAITRVCLLRPGLSFPQYWTRRCQTAASISVFEIDRIIVWYERFITKNAARFSAT